MVVTNLFQGTEYFGTNVLGTNNCTRAVQILLAQYNFVDVPPNT